MHRVTLNISDKSYDEFLAYLKNYKKKDIEIIEDRDTPEFVVSSLDEAKKRVYDAEKNDTYTAHEVFCEGIDQFTNSL